MSNEFDGTLDLNDAAVTKPYLFDGPAFEELTPATIAPVADVAIGKRFVMGGNAYFTVHNTQTGNRYTFRVNCKKAEPGSRWPDAHFVALLSGPDNTEDYAYMGMLDPNTGFVRLTKASKFSMASVPYRVIVKAMAALWGTTAMPDGWTVIHAGRCGRCGRMLTVPESVASGFGPECIGKL